MSITCTRVNPVFARHETFHPRFSWLKKGFDQAKEDPRIFLLEDATVQLGVGKNMVRSIRYWCHTFKLLESDSNSGSKPTDFGQQLLNESGWDPYLEDPASLWLLHWHLLKPTCEAATWYFTFNLFAKNQFSVDDLWQGLSNYRETLDKKIVDSSLKKDINCLLRMYVDKSASLSLKEDTIDSPFSQLGIIQALGEGKNYSFSIGVKPNLPPAIIVAACLEYTAETNSTASTIAISRLLYGEGSPGMAFKLSESALCEAIEYIANQCSKIFLSETAGLIQFSFNQNPHILAKQILTQYYMRL